METKSNTKTMWIFVALVAVLGVIGCCALAAVGAITVPAIARGVRSDGLSWWFEVESPGQEMTERVEQTFEVGSAPKLEINSFAGATTIRAGDDDTIRVVATKHAKGSRNLDAIVVEMTEEGDRVVVRTSHPLLNNASNLRVDLEITVPADTDLDVKLGAGSVQVRDVLGAQQIEAGAGGIEIRGAAGPVSTKAGAGGIDYAGRPAGVCSFQAGAGGIVLRLPADANVTVDLSAGLGGVNSALPVDGTVTRRSVRGTIGTGDEASLTATAGIGGVDLVRQ